MKIIDMHVHVFPDDLAEKTVNFLAKEANTQSYLNGTVSDLRKSMAEAGIMLSVNQPIATKPSQVVSINSWANTIHSENVISFGTIHPLFEDFAGEIKRLKGLGLKGIKFHPDYQKFYPDDEAIFPLYDCLVHHNIIALFHAGIDIGIYPPVHATPQRLANVLNNFPRMKMIAAHLGGYKCWDEVEECLVGRELFFDTSYVIDYMEQERFVKIMKEHGFHKILFATDSPWKPQSDELKKIAALPLPENAMEDIFFRNAAKLLDI